MRLTYSAILKELNKIKPEYRTRDLFDTVDSVRRFTIRIQTTIRVITNDDKKVIDVPVNIISQSGIPSQNILKEVAYKINKFEGIWSYDDKPALSNYAVEDFHAYARFGNSNAVLHEEQECGIVWIEFCDNDMFAPITYDTDYTKNGNLTGVIRKETNDIKSH